MGNFSGPDLYRYKKERRGWLLLLGDEAFLELFRSWPNSPIPQVYGLPADVCIGPPERDISRLATMLPIYSATFEPVPPYMEYPKAVLEPQYEKVGTKLVPIYGTDEQIEVDNYICTGFRLLDAYSRQEISTIAGV